MTVFKNFIEHSELPKSGLKVLAMLERAGYEAYFVGGVVRDILLQRKFNDVDITTNADWKDVAAVAKKNGLRVFESGVKYGTITVYVDDDAIEVTTYRVDGQYVDSRRPDSVSKASSLSEDLLRRDFTINALACNSNGDVIDEFYSVNDLLNGTLKTVGDPYERFDEDALRLMRLARFASELGFGVDETTFDAAIDLKSKLNFVAAERLQKELSKLLLGDHVFETMTVYSDLIVSVISELQKSVSFDQHSPWHHLDVYEHTAKVVSECPKKLDARLAALFHDCAKPDVFELDDSGTGHFHGHAQVSAAIARSALTRFRFSRFMVDWVEWLVENHDRDLHATPASAKRLLRSADGDVFKVRALLSLRKADILGQRKDVELRLASVEEFEKALDCVLDDDSIVFSLRHLAVDGNDMIKLGLESREIGQMLDMLLDEVVDGTLENDHDLLVDRAKEVISK